jgi:uncharacterized membrane protein YtjA (UPF0391 family)
MRQRPIVSAGVSGEDAAIVLGDGIAPKKESSMIKWAIIFFLISLVAGFFGFTGAAADFRGIAKILFFIAIVVFLIVLIFGVFLGTLVF